MKLLQSLFLALLLSQVCLGHEFWLQPTTFQFPSTGDATIPIRVGMNFEGDAWGGTLSKVFEIVCFHGDQKETLVEAGGLKKPVIDLKADEPGQYLLGFTNQSTFIELKPDEFEKYVLSEGLQSIVEQRKELGESDKPGKELYRRCAKTLLQFGDAEGSEAYGQEFQFPLELTALSNPYSSQTQLQTFRLTFQNEPLVNAQVVIWHKDGDRVNRRELRSDKHGKVEFPLTQSGKWMVSTVHMERIDDNADADWQSYWGSYTFGY